MDASMGGRERAETMDRRKEKRGMRNKHFLKKTRRNWGEIKEKRIERRKE